MLGGDVSVTSVTGEGSVFTLRFPAQLGAAPVLARVDATAAAGQGNQRLVLMIDDEESARDLTARSLVRLGFEVRTAATGAEGIELARSCGPASFCSISICRTSPAGMCSPCSARAIAAISLSSFILSTTIVSAHCRQALANIWSNHRTVMCSRPRRFASRALPNLQSRLTRRLFPTLPSRRERSSHAHPDR
jgi:CheY-like chemotaxis protein